MSDKAQKATSILLMAIMVAGGLTFAAPHTVPAMAQSNPNLIVSAENPAFNNYFSGPQVVEVVIIDPDIDETNESKGAPDVTLNGKTLSMVQATDGKWYAYFASLEQANEADTTTGGGLDFGVICEDESDILVVETVLFGDTTNLFSDSDGVAFPGSGTCASYTFAAQTINVVREEKTINPDSGSVNFPLGQVFPPFVDATDEGIWPFVQLYNLNPTGNVNIVYNRGGGSQSVTLTFDTVDHLASLSLDREKYPNNAQVHFDITDPWLNIDPTDEDSWTWIVEGPSNGAIYYQAFDENGEAQTGSPNIQNQISNLMCESNCVLTLDRNPNNSPKDVVEYQDNDDSNITHNDLNIDPITLANEEGLITITENSSSSGIFTSYDEQDESVLRTTDDPARGTTAVIDYNETPQSILIEYSFATINIDPLGNEWASGQEIPIVLTDADANRNSRADEDLDVFEPTAIIPTLVTGSPLTIGNFSTRIGTETIANGTETIANGTGTIANGTGTIANGTGTIANGTGTIANGTGTIANGTGTTLIFTFGAIITEDSIDRRGTIANGTGTTLIFTYADGLSDDIATTTNILSYDFRSLGINSTVSSVNITGAVTSSDQSLQGTIQVPDSSTVNNSVTFTFNNSSTFDGTQPLVLDLMRFGFTDDSRVADQIIRLELEENGDNTGVFIGTLEYVMANQLNIVDAATYTGLVVIDDEVSLIAIEDLTDEDTLTVTYADLGRDGVVTPVSDDEAAISHSGSVSFDQTSYKVADTVTITLRDADLNTNSDTIEVYTIPTDGDFVGRAGTVFDTVIGATGIQGRVLDITFDDRSWEERTCTLPAGTDNGFGDTGFTLRETASASGVFEGDFQIPTEWCRDIDEPESVTGLDFAVDYVDYRDASGEIIEVGDSAGIRANTGSVNLDRPVYPIPFGNTPGGSIFELHETAGDALDQRDLAIHVRVTDADFDISGSGADTLATTITRGSGSNEVTGYGPLKITINRGSSETLLGFAGGSTANTAPNVIPNSQVGTIPSSGVTGEAREYGPIAETAPSSGTFEIDISIAWNEGPLSAECPGPNDTNACILQGDILVVEYTDPADASGNLQTVTDSATFDLRNGVLRSDKPVYIIGSDMILTLIEADFDLDNDTTETYPLDLIEWDGDDSTVTLSNGAFDPEPGALRETGDSTGIFQVVIEIPSEIDGVGLDRGEEIELEYTDWGPAGADYVGDDDEDIQHTIYTSNFGATIELDQAVYTWTDKVFITIVAPDHNFDSDLVDEIGETNSDPIRVYTREGGELDEYRLVETGTDTGIFSGEVILTGFTHDADGDSTTGDTNGNDLISSSSRGEGPTDGLLPADDDDGISVSFEYNEDDHAIASAIIRWNVGDVQWLEPSYPASGSGVVRVVDPDMNWHPESVDNFDVDVYSDKDGSGIKLTVTETQDASGIFEGTVLFTINDTSSGHRLRIAEGDTITASYADNTLPSPDSRSDERDIKGTTIIGTLVNPLKRAVVSNVSLTDNTGNALEQVAIGQQIQITAQITSGQQVEQDYTYLVQINDANDVTLSLTWTSGTLNANQNINPSVSWQPTVAGSYTATVFVWESIENPTALSPQSELAFTVS